MAKLASRLTAIANKADHVVAEAIDETADFILNFVRIFAPVDTGRLRGSYKKKVETPLNILIGSAVNYSIFQEYGTSRMRSQPHLTPAFRLGEFHLKNVLARKMQSL